MLAPDSERASAGRVYRPGAEDRWLLAVLLLAAAAFAVGVLWWRSVRQLGFPSHDIYAFFYPNTQYALHSLREWSGLLWNPYQDCGQPFFAFGQLGLLYPVNVVFYLLPREPALVASVILNLAIAGAGVFLLCRQMQLGRAAAIGGALAFQFGGTALQLASWSPIHIGAYVWLPVAMWATERLIARPAPRGAALLGLVLAIQMLPGFVQTSVFTYQLIALRALWVVAIGQVARRGHFLAAVAAALLLGPLVAGLQLIPSLEVARLSLREWQLPDTALGAGVSWALARRMIEDFTGWQSPALLAVAAVPLLWQGARRQRADVGFYVLVGGLYYLLSLGPGMPLFDLYARLPLAAAFRGAGRLIWVSNLAAVVLVAFAIDAVLKAEARRGIFIACVIAGALAVQALAPAGLSALDWLFAGLVVAAIAATGHASSRPAVGVALPLLIAVRLLCFGHVPLFDLRAGDLYGGSADAIATVRERLTPQDRVLLISGGLEPYAFMPKAAMLARIPSIFDYETQASRSYVEYFTYMRTGRPLRSLRDWYWIFGKLILPTLQRPLFDLTAARYLIVNPATPQAVQPFAPPLQPLAESAAGIVYENPQALARARYVPRVQVMAPEAILPALAEGAVDARAVALLSTPPASGFLGQDGGHGSVEITRDAPERVVMHVEASAPGFVFLADQHFPGWQATVNGEAREIMRANHTFRLIEVPAGRSVVELRYRPRSVLLGALLSLLGVALCVALGRRRSADLTAPDAAH